MPKDIEVLILQTLIELLLRSSHMSDSVAQIKAALASARQDAADANQRVIAHLGLLQEQNASLLTVEQQLKDQIESLKASPADTTENEAALQDILSQVQTLRGNVQAIDASPPAPPAPVVVDEPPAAGAAVDPAPTNPPQTEVNDGSAPSIAQAPNNLPLV